MSWRTARGQPGHAARGDPGLADAGFVESRRGRYGGTFVSEKLPEPSAGGPFDAAEVEDALTLRSALETGAAELAAARDLSRASARTWQVPSTEASATDLSDYRRKDSRLHLAIAEATASAVADGRGRRRADAAQRVPRRDPVAGPRTWTTPTPARDPRRRHPLRRSGRRPAGHGRAPRRHRFAAARLPDLITGLPGMVRAQESRRLSGLRSRVAAWRSPHARAVASIVVIGHDFRQVRRGQLGPGVQCRCDSHHGCDGPGDRDPHGSVAHRRPVRRTARSGGRRRPAHPAGGR